MKSNIPFQVGDYCTFYDDGKTSESRTYAATVLRIVSKEGAKNIKFDGSCILEPEKPVSLFEIWEEYVKNRNSDHIYAEDTDYFIECAIPRYDACFIWFVRSADGGWWSLDIQNCWQHGKLVSNSKLVTTQYYTACNALVRHFAKAVFPENDFFWIDNRIGDACCFSNMVTLTPDDMVFILENNIHSEEILEWFEHIKESSFINLRSWHRGLRPEMIKKQS